MSLSQKSQLVVHLQGMVSYGHKYFCKVVSDMVFIIHVKVASNLFQGFREDISSSV